MFLKTPNPRTAIIQSYNHPVLYNNIVLYKGRRLIRFRLFLYLGMKTLLLVFLVLLGLILSALQYKHLWKDVPELFKDLKKKKDK